MSIQDLKPGDIGFIMHHDNWVSRTIGWFMGSRWSHTFLVQEVGDFSVYTLETDEWDVDHGSIEFYYNDPNTSFEIWRDETIRDDQRYDIVEEAQITFGQSYGWLQLISMALRNMLRRIGIRFSNFIRQGITCAGVACTGYVNAKISGWEDIDPEDMDTEDTYKHVQSLGFVKVFQKDANKGQ